MLANCELWTQNIESWKKMTAIYFSHANCELWTQDMESRKKWQLLVFFLVNCELKITKKSEPHLLSNLTVNYLSANADSLFLTPPIYPLSVSLLSTHPMNDSFLGSVHPNPVPGLLSLNEKMEYVIHYILLSVMTNHTFWIATMVDVYFQDLPFASLDLLAFVWEFCNNCHSSQKYLFYIVWIRGSN